MSDELINTEALDERQRRIAREEIERYMRSLLPAEDRLLRAKEVAQLIGGTTWRVYQLHKSGELPALEKGRSKRWRESTVRAYINSAPTLKKAVNE